MGPIRKDKTIAEQGLRGAGKALAILGTGIFGAAIGYWNSVSPYMASHDLAEYDGYFDAIMMLFGGLVGLILGGFFASRNCPVTAWIWAFGASAVVAGVLPFAMRGVSYNHSREAVGWLCPLTFALVLSTSLAWWRREAWYQPPDSDD